MKALPSQEYLRSRIEYNPETGEARWKKVDSSHGPRWKHFNSNFAECKLSYSINLLGHVYTRARILYKLHYGKEVRRVKFLNGDSDDCRACNLADTNDVAHQISRKANVKNKQRLYNPIPKDVKDLLSYNHRTGKLTWKPRDNPRFNTQFAGRVAGGKAGNGYIRVRINMLGYAAHRLAWFLYYNEDPGEYQIDHKDGVRDNNCIANLRLASPSLNSQAKNRKNLFYKRESTGKYRSIFSIRNNDIYLGEFSTQEEAQQAYEDALTRYKSEYTPTPGEQRVLDELYNTYPHCDKTLQQVAHEIQIRAVQWYDTAYRRTGKFSVDQPLKLLDERLKQEILEHYCSGKVVEFYSPSTEHWQALAPDSSQAFEHEDLVFRARLPESFY